MLCPNALDVSDELAAAYSTIVQVDSLAYASMNTLIGTLNPDPSWLGAIRTRMNLLSEAGARWQKNRPTLWAETLTSFNSYYALFSGFTDAVEDLGDNTDAWIQVLEQLSAALASAEEKTKAAESEFSLEIENLKNVESLLSDELDKAWQELSSEEQAIVDLATEIGSLQDQLDNLQSNISSSEITGEASYTRTTVSIAYSVLSSSGESIPYLSIVGLLYTVGDLVYDMIVTDQEITSTINKIVSLREEATAEAQAAAMTKAIIQLINRFDKQLIAIQSQLPAFSDMWEAEKQKVDQLINAIQAGAVPSQVISLVAMPTAAATWQQLSDMVSKISEAAESGGSVSIITSDGENAVQKG